MKFCTVYNSLEQCLDENLEKTLCMHICMTILEKHQILSIIILIGGKSDYKGNSLELCTVISVHKIIKAESHIQTIQMESTLWDQYF